MPLVSIIIPCYNQAHLISETLDSVLHQTFIDWEAIIVNDGSPDNLDEVVKQYIIKEPRIFYLKQENKGASAARNNGIRHAMGKYCLSLDSDDLLAPFFLEHAVSFMESHSEYSVFSPRIEYFGKRTGVHSVTYIDYKHELISNSVVGPSLYLRSDCIKVNGYDENFRKGCEDWEFWIRLLYPDKKVYQTDEVLHYYRQFGGTENHISTIAGQNRPEVLNSIFKKHIDKYLEFYPVIQDIIVDQESIHNWADRRLPQIAKKIQVKYQAIYNMFKIVLFK